MLPIVDHSRLIATLDRVRSLVGFYGAGDLVGYDQSTRLPAGLERPAVARGLTIPA